MKSWIDGEEESQLDATMMIY